MIPVFEKVTTLSYSKSGRVSDHLELLCDRLNAQRLLEQIDPEQFELCRALLHSYRDCDQLREYNVTAYKSFVELCDKVFIHNPLFSAATLQSFDDFIAPRFLGKVDDNDLHRESLRQCLLRLVFFPDNLETQSDRDIFYDICFIASQKGMALRPEESEVFVEVIERAKKSGIVPSVAFATAAAADTTQPYIQASSDDVEAKVEDLTQRLHTAFTI